MIRITLEQLQERAKQRPADYVETVLAAADSRDAQGVWLTEESLEGLRRRYGVEEKPSTGQLLTNFVGATARWAKAGFPVASEAEFRARMAICRGDETTGRPACQYWRARALFPYCRRCGCLGWKPWLATERCPEGLWGPSGAIQGG